MSSGVVSTSQVTLADTETVVGKWDKHTPEEHWKRRSVSTKRGSSDFEMLPGSARGSAANVPAIVKVAESLISFTPVLVNRRGASGSQRCAMSACESHRP
jgi:hypothetical protein